MKKFFFGCLILITACQTAAQNTSTESTPTSAPQTQTLPVPTTIAVTSTPAFTPTPFPLFFTEEFDSTDSTAWTSFQTGGESSPTLRIENGLLRIDISSPNTWYYAIHNAHEYEDAAITAKFSSAHSSSAGLICRYSQDGWFEFNLTSDGTYNILFGQLLTEGIANYLPIASDSSEYLTPGSLEYEIGLTCQGNSLLLYINGKLFRKLDVSRFELSNGKVGISTSSFEEAPAIVTFDWFKVAEPE